MTDLATFLLVFLVGSCLLGYTLKGLQGLQRLLTMTIRRIRWRLLILLALPSALAGCSKAPTAAVPNCPAPFVMTREACQAYADSVARVRP